MRRGFAAALLLLGSLGVLGLGATAPAKAALGPGAFTRGTHPGIGTSGPRDFSVYEPSAPAGGARPLVVFLHGCNQNAKDAAIGTRWTELAERRDFTVVFPEQSVVANGIQCWNWFQPDHQTRDVGEPAVIAAITRSVMASSGTDPSRVYVMGVSAGADMAMIMGATHPDLFAGVSGFAGCAYSTCADVTGTLAHQAQGTRARVLPALLIQGTVDPLNNFAMGET
ncbi:MAG: PHB depolymerase family esterase, partial [Actinomycetota bacterium]|nr:PHB depolymerase family esterase [Actinomycetota bacterium]